MHTKAALMNYEKLSFSITTTAPVEDWRAMLKQIDGLTDGRCRAWPLSGFYGCVQKMLEDLDRTHADVLIKTDQAGAACPKCNIETRPPVCEVPGCPMPRVD